jgi:hypothetical protein
MPNGPKMFFSILSPSKISSIGVFGMKVNRGSLIRIPPGDTLFSRHKFVSSEGLFTPKIIIHIVRQLPTQIGLILFVSEGRTTQKSFVQ